ncbi:MAG: type I methionyl aminopeptidase [Candidatus Moranbacteria bacterium]|nr:type I methionyl aminopeptidase [Candidatus Moranbacteria bacterium]
MNEWIKTEEEIGRMRQSGKRLALVLETVIESVCPGMTTLAVDVLAERLIREQGGIPIFKGYGGGSGRPFPATVCTSLNNEVVHGIPNQERVIRDGDLLKLDIGMRYDGMVTDMARTVAVGTISDEAKKLLRVTEESLSCGIQTLCPGGRLSVYARAVQEHVEKNGFSVVRDLVGHGVGRELHEEPQVPNYYSSSFREVVLRKGMALALEPMVNLGGFAVTIAPDDWTFVTKDGSLSAHFEDTVVITEKGAEIVTRRF